MKAGSTPKTDIFRKYSKRQRNGDNQSLEAEITKFHVKSRIQLRYAITDVETQIRNRHFLPKEVFFDMYIPEEAFVSDFSMVIKDKTYQAKVEPKKVAEETFENSFSTSALLQSNSQPEFTDGQQVSN